MLITPDAFDGFTRSDEFERSLGIAPNMRLRPSLAEQDGCENS